MKTAFEKVTGFYDCARVTLLICRCIGFLPICGLTKQDSELTSHTWKSPYTLIYVPSLALHILWTGVHLYDNVNSDFELRRFFGLFFTTIVLIAALLLIQYSRKWNKMIRKIESIEKSLPPFKNPGFVVKSINLIMVTIFSLAMCEYVLYMTYTIEITLDCFLVLDDSGLYLKSYFKSIYPWFYDYFPFDYISFVFIQFSKVQYAFMWSLIDMFIIVSSLYLVHRFKAFNYYMCQKQRELCGSGIGSLPWSELQVHYTKLTRLVKIINKSLNSFVILSFTSNLCFIGQQIFFVLNKLLRHNFVKYSECLAIHSTDWHTTLYMVISLSFLIGRTILVSFIAAHLHSLSREPLNALHTVPTSAYDYDLQRFMDQVYYSRIGISGHGFFYVTRGMILTVVATLLTYELVLLQF